MAEADSKEMAQSAKKYWSAEGYLPGGVIREVDYSTQSGGLDPMFENAEWDAALLPSARGSGAFLEAAQLVGGFTFGTLGAHRLESRVLLSNGRANAALRKLGAVQEGVLRRSHRVGRNGRMVKVWEFRTALADPDAMETVGGCHGEELTRAGRFLRRTGIAQWPPR